MLELINKYYKRVSEMALKNLKDEKKFQFRKHLTNHSLLKAVESHYESISKSEEAVKLIKEYTTSMNNMYIEARKEYNLVLEKIKSTNDILLKQKFLTDYAKNGCTGFIAENGARWNIETYSNMFSRHVNNELVRMDIIEQIKAQGRKTVKISEHGTACELCKPYEGKILTFKELEEAKIKGLFHPNCLHFILFVVGGV